VNPEYPEAYDNDCNRIKLPIDEAILESAHDGKYKAFTTLTGFKSALSEYYKEVWAIAVEVHGWLQTTSRPIKARWGNVNNWREAAIQNNSKWRRFCAQYICLVISHMPLESYGKIW